MNQYEELYHHTVRSVHQHIEWNYLTPFKQLFIPDREDHSIAFVRTSYTDHEGLTFYYGFDPDWMESRVLSLPKERRGNVLLTLNIMLALHETGHQRQTLVMMDEEWHYESMLSYTQHHGYEWRKCMKELGVKRPKAKDLSFTWTQEFTRPDLLQQIIDDISEDVWDMLD